MRWRRRKHNQEEEPELEKKSFFSFSWLSKLFVFPPKSPKCPSCKPKHIANIPSPKNTEQQISPSPYSHVSAIAPRRRSVGDCDRPRPPLPLRQRRHSSFDGEWNLGTSSMTLGSVIPFSFAAKNKEATSLVLNLNDSYHSAENQTLPRYKKRRRRKLKNRPIVKADDDDTSRKSFSRRIRSRKQRIRVCSPRKEKMESIAERFAVVKRSSEPEREFRLSMVEMIMEKGIGQMEELESLLACYLTLNSDEHHELIVKVFRQVWFDIKPERFLARPKCDGEVDC